jgi:hypothetical protein
MRRWHLRRAGKIFNMEMEWSQREKREESRSKLKGNGALCNLSETN